MVDNKPKEEIAENEIRGKLLRKGFLCTKPSFDQQGADLLVVESISATTTRFLKVQCKYRSFSKSKPNKVDIPIIYATDNFVVFVLTQDEMEEENLLVFFREDLQKWPQQAGKYILLINKNTVIKSRDKKFDAKIAERLWEKLKAMPLKNYTTIIIDGIFLERAIMNTKKIYEDIWPDKQLNHPAIDDVINRLLEYNRFNKVTSAVDCILYLSKDHNLERWVAVPESDSINNSNLAIHRSGEIISFEILEKLERLVNSENIILVADDISYEAPLNELKEKGVDIILIKLKEEQGGNLFTHFRWGDINYPLALAMGLNQFEL